MPRESEKRSFRYQRRAPDTMKARANQSTGNFDTIFKQQFKVWKPKEGKNIIRILPPTWEDADHFGMDIYVNYNIGADKQQYLSLSKMLGEPDPLAEAKREAERDGDKDLAKDLSPSKRLLYWLIDRNDEDEGPQLWAPPVGFDKDVANVCYDEDTKEVVFIDDPENGCDLKFVKEGTGLKTKYPGSQMKLMKPSPLCDDEAIQEDWLAFIQENTLKDVLNFYSYEHIKMTFNGQAGRDKDEDEEQEKPSRSRREESEERPQRTRRSEPDEDEAPPRRRREETEDKAPPRRSREPEPEEEAEADEKPRSSLRDRLRARRGASEEPPFDED